MSQLYEIRFCADAHDAGILEGYVESTDVRSAVEQYVAAYRALGGRTIPDYLSAARCTAQEIDATFVRNAQSQVWFPDYVVQE